MTQRALIVGLGIAGMASAMSLKKAGWEPVIVERAPERQLLHRLLGMPTESMGPALAFDDNFDEKM